VDLYEYQGKQLFREAEIPVPRSWTIHASGPDPAEVAASFGLPLVAKAQVLTGGRGKAGGVRVCATSEALAAAVREIMGMDIRGHAVTAVLLEEAVEIDREFYLAIAVDRWTRRPLLMFSTRGGVDIEDVARRDPQAILRLHIDPLDGLADDQVRELIAWAGLADRQPGELGELVRAVWRLFCSHEATLVEINPLVLTASGRYMALDSKVSIDDNALFRHATLRGFGAENLTDERERVARDAGFRYVSLDGDIGVLGNGAGLVMSTLDLIAAAGGRPADFLDVGGGAREAQIAAALDVVLSDPRVKVLLVTIFGGITRCDEVANGLLAALRAASSPRATSGCELPVVVRLDGNRAAEGRALIDAAAHAGVHTAETAWGGVQAAVGLAEQTGDGAERPPARTPKEQA
jgi:succinyl-CoA synthetase beta subunit